MKKLLFIIGIILSAITYGQLIPGVIASGYGSTSIRYVCGIGDDVIHDSFDQLSDSSEYFVTNLAVSGDLIQNQIDDWNALSSATQAAFDYITIQVGVNDIEAGAAYATMVTRYESLLSTIHADIKTDCRILMYTMTPCKGHTGISDAEVTVLKNANLWIDSIQTHVDYASTKNWDDLTDGNDSIAAAYNLNRDYLLYNQAGENLVVINMMEDIEILYNNGWEIIFTLDFNDWDQHPNGLHKDTLSAYLGSNFAYLGSENDDHADDAAILKIDGSNVLRSYYDEGHCCTEGDSSGGVGGGGTGIDLQIWLNAAHTGYKHLGFFMNVNFEDIFAQPEANKMPGVRSSPGDGATGARIMVSEDAANNWGGGDSLNVLIYDVLYPDGYSTNSSTSGNVHMQGDSITRGEWLSYGHMVYRGTDHQNNFNHHVYLRGDYIGYEKNGYWWNSNHTSAGGWDVAPSNGISIATFMGGNTNDYNSPWDQHMDLDDIFVGIPILNGLAVWKGQYDSVSDEPDSGFEIPMPPCANWNQTTKTRN